MYNYDAFFDTKVQHNPISHEHNDNQNPRYRSDFATTLRSPNIDSNITQIIQDANLTTNIYSYASILELREPKITKIITFSHLIEFLMTSQIWTQYRKIRISSCRSFFGSEFVM